MRRLTILAVALGSSLLAADSATACSCVPIDAREQLEAADGAFVGRLIEVREVDPPAEGEPTSSADPVDYVYRVGRVYNRGPGLHRGRRVRVRSARSDASCGLPNQVGELIGLFVDRRHHRWHGNACLTTTPRRMRRAAASASSAVSRPGSAGCG
ncbi:MAG: hypothetical protein ABW142_10795 [Thermoleophilaceae bacterium]